MQPDFNKKTVDVLAKRAAYRCSNPDCRVSTVGPNSDPEKATTIGEAAHICGARDKSARYNVNMSDIARAEITNAIWLCRNCHKKIDRDEQLYAPDLLFAWREQHEEFVAAELGNASDRIRTNLDSLDIEEFSSYPPVIRRIAIDKPEGWEWRLTAELMRHLNKKPIRRLQDLRDNLYVSSVRVVEESEVPDWANDVIEEMLVLISPVTNLLSRLTDSWGTSGVSGDIHEIHHICCLIRDYLEQIIHHEERLHHTRVPKRYKGVAQMLQDLLGSQIDKFDSIPDFLDEAVSLAMSEHEGTTEDPLVIQKTIEFTLPKNWNKKFERELRQASGKRSLHQFDGCLTLLVLAAIVFVVVIA